jgi:hypothetical protein
LALSEVCLKTTRELFEAKPFSKGFLEEKLHDKALVSAYNKRNIIRISRRCVRERERDKVIYEAEYERRRYDERHSTIGRSMYTQHRTNQMQWRVGKELTTHLRGRPS